jgi:hypothetical protein
MEEIRKLHAQLDRLQGEHDALTVAAWPLLEKLDQLGGLAWANRREKSPREPGQAPGESD